MNDVEILSRIKLLRGEIENLSTLFLSVGGVEPERLIALNRELEKAVAEHNKLIVTDEDVKLVKEKRSLRQKQIEERSDVAVGMFALIFIIAAFFGLIKLFSCFF